MVCLWRASALCNGLCSGFFQQLMKELSELTWNHADKQRGETCQVYKTQASSAAGASLLWPRLSGLFSAPPFCPPSLPLRTPQWKEESSEMGILPSAA